MLLEKMVPRPSDSVARLGGGNAGLGEMAARWRKYTHAGGQDQPRRRDPGNSSRELLGRPKVAGAIEMLEDAVVPSRARTKCFNNSMHSCFAYAAAPRPQALQGIRLYKAVREEHGPRVLQRVTRDVQLLDRRVWEPRREALHARWGDMVFGDVEDPEALEHREDIGNHRARGVAKIVIAETQLLQRRGNANSRKHCMQVPRGGRGQPVVRKIERSEASLCRNKDGKRLGICINQPNADELDGSDGRKEKRWVVHFRGQCRHRPVPRMGDALVRPRHLSLLCLDVSASGKGWSEGGRERGREGGREGGRERKRKREEIRKKK